MAISRVSQATAQSSTITIPGTYAAGDLILIVAARANTTPATVPAGWVTLSSAGSSGQSIVTACKYAQSASESAPSFTNAGILNCAVYHSSLGIVFPSMAVATAGGGSSATINYAALAQYKTGVDANWYIGAAAQLNTANSLETAPSGMTNVNFDSITGLKSVLHDTNADQLSNWALTNVTVTTAAVYRSVVIQLVEMTYTFPSGGGGGLILSRAMNGGLL
jgi:hypothetical protein